MHLYTSVGTIDTTSNHPFYVVDKGWVAAGDLVSGDKIYQLDGTIALVTGSQFEKLDVPVKVYNLEVEDFHSYFVGDVPILVHNYKSSHAEQRQSEGRNVGTAINDLQRSRPSDVYIQSDDGRYVVRGQNGRVHILETDGGLVTTMNKATNFLKRVASGRYVRPTNQEYSDFVDTFDENLNHNWDGYR